MDRDELIARREAIARDLTAALAAREVDKFQLIAFMDRHEIIAALQSRPAPTEERAREILTEEALATGEWASIDVMNEGQWNPWPTAVRAMLRFAKGEQ